MSTMTNTDRADRAKRALDAYAEDHVTHDWDNPNDAVELLQLLIGDLHHLFRLRYRRSDSIVRDTFTNGARLAQLERREDPDV